MARFKQPTEYTPEDLAPEPASPIKNGVKITLIVPPWQEPAISIFREELQNWLNRAYNGELNPGTKLELMVP